MTGGLRAAADRLARAARSAVGPFGSSERELSLAVAAAETELAKPQPVRVLRLLEYTYADIETMEADRLRWYIQEGRTVNSGVTIRSTALPLEVLEEEPQLIQSTPTKNQE